MGTRHVLDGIKVADFSWIGATPMATRELALQGATVIRVECHRAVDDLRVSSPFKNGVPHLDGSAVFGMFNAGKYSISLDLNRPRAKEVARRLILWGDIVAENMTPGTMAKWGLDYESCRAIKPDLIYLSSSTEGQSGPLCRMHGHGYQAVGTVGFSHLTGWPDRGPTLLKNAYTDTVAPFFSATLLVGALAYRKRTGRGMYIDQSQNEAGAALLGHVYLDCAVNSRKDMKCQGNRDQCAAPHGIYPCQGDDRWVALAVTNETEWEALCQAIGIPEWTKGQKFRGVLARKRNEDELDRLLAEWTASRSPEQVTVLLQGKGVPAAVVQNGEGLFQDPQLKYRDRYHQLPHKVQGMPTYRGPAYRFSETPFTIAKASPCLGEDNDWVYKDVLGFSDDEIGEMLADGTITTDADVPHKR